MEIYYKPSALKDLKKIPKTESKKITKKLEILAQDPTVGKPLKGEFKGLNSLRAWPHRIIYEIRANGIIVYSVSHRQSAYKS